MRNKKLLYFRPISQKFWTFSQNKLSNQQSKEKRQLYVKTQKFNTVQHNSPIEIFLVLNKSGVNILNHSLNAYGNCRISDQSVIMLLHIFTTIRILRIIMYQKGLNLLFYNSRLMPFQQWYVFFFNSLDFISLLKTMIETIKSHDNSLCLEIQHCSSIILIQIFYSLKVLFSHVYYLFPIKSGK